MRLLLALLTAVFLTSAGTANAASYFKTPSANIVCFITADSVDCAIKSGLKPKPKRRDCDLGDPVSDRLSLGRTGGATPVTCAGDVGPIAGERRAKVLAYGKSKVVGRLRCVSRESGLTCRNRSHGFLLSRKLWKAL